MDKRRKLRKVHPPLRQQVLELLQVAISMVADTGMECPNQIFKSPPPTSTTSTSDLHQQLEEQFFLRNGDQDIHYLQDVDNFIQALKKYGNNLLHKGNYNPTILAALEWDKFIIDEALQHAAGAQEEKEDNIKGDPTRKPIEEIFTELGLDGEAQILQCRRCKQWTTKYKILELRSLDEPGTVKGECKNKLCGHRWTEYS